MVRSFNIRFAGLFFTALLLPALGDDSAVRKELEGLYRSWGAAIENRDLASIDALLTPHFTFTDAGGISFDRHHFLNTQKSMISTLSFGSWMTELEQLTVTGEQAIATANTNRFYTLTSAKGKGDEFYEEQRSQDTWRKTGQGWKLERSQELLSAGGVVRKPVEGELHSPVLAALARDVKAGKGDAVDGFWKKLNGKAPLVETISGDETHLWVTFVWRGTTQTEEVKMYGGLPAAEFEKPLIRLAGTDLWYRTERIPRDARFTYSIGDTKTVNKPGKQGERPTSVQVVMTRPDPFNPRLFAGGSVVELPNAQAQPWINRVSGTRQGEVKEHNRPSKILKQDRTVLVYTPPGYNAQGQPCVLLVVFDAESALAYIPVPTILDNLIARGTLPPTVAVMIYNNDRFQDLACSESFADFVARELVPWVRQNYCVSADPRSAIVTGVSLGGLMSAYTALRHSDVFGNVLSQSGSFWYYPSAEYDSFLDRSLEREPGWLTRQFVAAPQLPVRFYLEAGRFESSFGVDLLAENRNFRNVLEAKGYAVIYQEHNGGHDYLRWRGTLADGLIALIGAEVPK